MPPHAIFCGVCGELVRTKKEERRAGSEGGAGGQDDSVTTRLPLLSRINAKIVRSYQSLKNNGLSKRTYKSGSLPQQRDASSVTNVVGIKPTSDEISESALASRKVSSVTGSASDAWGWLPALSLTSAVGVFLIALAAEAGRVSSQWADPLFWFGLIVLYVPIAARIISRRPERRERIALLVMLGSALYLLRYLEQPLSFAFNDEFMQWRNAQNIATSGRLFLASPLLPIGSYYPGLQIATTALSSLTGFSIFASGMIVLNVAGLMLVLALYLFYESISGSAQVAGIATLLYMAKPTFFSDTLFHYEDLAMPLMAFVLFAVARRSYTPKGRHRGLTLAIWFGIAAVVITHHVTSYVLDVFLLLWTAVFLLLKTNASFQLKRDKNAPVGPGGAALLAVVLTVAWLAYSGARVVGYLYPTIETTVTQFIQILTGQGTARQFFHDTAGFVEPQWERMIAFAAVGLISLGLPFGIIQIWRHYRANAAMLTLAIGALSYPVSLLIHLTHAGVNVGGRAQPYVFGTVAFVLAVGVTRFWLPRMSNWRFRVPLVGAIAIIFIGGWITGTSPYWDRLPGPYLPYGDQRSVQPESVTAAEWARSNLGTDQRVISDQVNTLLMATYGGEWVVTTVNDQIVVSTVYTAPYFSSDVKATLVLGRVQFIVVDRRLIGVDQTGYDQPVDPAMLAKFDGAQNVSRIFDSGNIAIYNVELITNGASTTPTPQSASSCTTAPSTGVSGPFPNVAKLYSGTLYSLQTGMKTGISLSGIHQQQGSICGYFSGKLANGPFKGTITANGHIQFVVTGNTGHGTFSIEGFLQPDGTIGGAYCGHAAGIEGTCSDYGVWSVVPTHSG